MTKQQFDSIMLKIYENGRVLPDEGEISQNQEFEFEALEQDFSQDEIEEALDRFGAR